LISDTYLLSTSLYPPALSFWNLDLFHFHFDLFHRSIAYSIATDLCTPCKSQRNFPATHRQPFTILLLANKRIHLSKIYLSFRTRSSTISSPFAYHHCHSMHPIRQIIPRNIRPFQSETSEFQGPGDSLRQFYEGEIHTLGFKTPEPLQALSTLFPLNSNEF